jgi:hypothetical protein
MRLLVAGLALLALGLRLAWQADWPTPIDLNLISTLDDLALVALAIGRR